MSNAIVPAWTLTNNPVDNPNAEEDEVFVFQSEDDVMPFDEQVDVDIIDKDEVA